MHVAFKVKLFVLFLRIYFYFSITCMHVTVGDYVHVSVLVQKTDLGALELELAVVLSCPTWVLGIQRVSLIKVENALLALTYFLKGSNEFYITCLRREG